MPLLVSLQALMITGHIFRHTVPDETAEERRELERYDESEVLSTLFSLNSTGWLLRPRPVNRSTANYKPKRELLRVQRERPRGTRRKRRRSK